MPTCIRCHRPTRAEDMQPSRRHCRACQRRADRLSYYRRRFAKLEKVNRRRAEQYGCAIRDVDYAAIYAAQIGQPCALCGAPTTPENAEFDHTTALATAPRRCGALSWIAYSTGGSHDIQAYPRRTPPHHL